MRRFLTSSVPLFYFATIVRELNMENLALFNMTLLKKRLCNQMLANNVELLIVF